jgi:hypothetical protein
MISGIPGYLSGIWAMIQNKRVMKSITRNVVIVVTVERKI